MPLYSKVRVIVLFEWFGNLLLLLFSIARVNILNL